MNVSIQGQKGSFHHIAQKALFPEDEAVTRTDFHEVFADVARGESERGIVAIENSIYGSINEVYDQLLQTELSIVGELYLRIEHCLIGLKGAQLSDITDIYSMGPALGQCTEWLSKHMSDADIHRYHDTAASVELIKEAGDPKKAAIASKAAAIENDLPVLVRGIETNKQNYTRFIVLSKKPNEGTDANKTSLAMRLNGALKAGALYNALGSFANRDINLSKIESRPVPGTQWEYMFYVDFDGTPSDQNIAKALQELESNGHQVKNLGTYKSAPIPVVEK